MVAVKIKGVFIMVYYDFLKPLYARQKSFYNKVYYSCLDNNDNKTYTLYSDNIKGGFNEVAKIVIDKKHQTKNRYYITNVNNFDKLTYKHICDFIFQFYQHKTTRKKLFTRNKFVKSKVFQYALPLEQV